jgi:hypothetical protein
VGWGQEAEGLFVRILAGEAAINNVDKKVVTDPMVEVRDASGGPVEGAEVTFRCPPSGPSATFFGASRTTTMKTDKQGRARAAGLTPNTDLGNFEIEVTVVHGSQQAETVIHQTNAVAPEPKKKKGVSWRLIAGISAGVAIGIVAAVNSGGSDESAPVTTITFGSTTVGTPR